MLASLVAAFSGPAAAFMYALLAVAAFALAVVVERAWSFARYDVDPDALLARAREAVAKGVPLEGDSSAPVTRVVAAGVAQAAAGSPPDTCWDAMTAAAIEADLRVRQRVGYLSMIASVATMIGLFGTVYGLILAFGALGDASAAQRAARLGEGSATAMSTTAFGLLVAIPALAAHSVAEARVRALLARIEATAARLLVVLQEARRAQGA